MAKRLQFRRVIWLAILLALAFAGLGYRLVDLQVIRHDELSAIAQQNTQREFLLEPRRGDILDAKGRVLATSILMKTVHADPVLIGDRQTQIAHALAPLLQMNESDLVQRLMRRIHQNKMGESVTNLDILLKDKIPVETWEKIQNAMTNLDLGLAGRKLSRGDLAFYNELRQKAVFARDEQLRLYPNQSLAAHVLGFATAEERQFEDHTVSELLGRDGVELALDSKLQGVRGWRLTETDRHNREVVALREQNVEPRDGLNVVLTLDVGHPAYCRNRPWPTAMEKHSPISISCIIVRPRTGEILAHGDPAQLRSEPARRRSPEDALRNRVISDVAEPGPLSKSSSSPARLNERHRDLERCVRLRARPFRLCRPNAARPRVLRCVVGREYHHQILQHRRGQNRHQTWENIVWPNTSTISALASARAFPCPAKSGASYIRWKNGPKYPSRKFPMGQGIAVTPLQMVMAMCAIANNGVLMAPMLVDRLEDHDHNVVAQYSPRQVRQIASESTAKLMVTALKTVVSPDGTAPKAALEHYTVAGKTGTAQKVEHGALCLQVFLLVHRLFPCGQPGDLHFRHDG